MRFVRITEKGIVLFLITILFLTACQSGGEASKEENYRDSFTAEEKEKGMASFELMKDVKVDAELTPVSQYKDGLKKYYMKNYCETKKKMGKEEFLQNPTIYGKSFSEIQDLIADELDFSFGGKQNILQDGFVLQQNLKKKDDSTYTLVSVWQEGGTWSDDEGRINCPYMYMDSEDDDMEGDQLVQDAYAVAAFVPDFEKAETLFLEDREETGIQMKEFLQQLLGRELYEKWDCIPVTKETVNTVNEVMEYTPDSEGYRQPPKEEFCLYRFLAAVDGLPFLDTYLTYQMKEGETASSLARAGSASDTSSVLMGLGQAAQEIAVSERGVISMLTAYTRYADKVYKDSAAVLDPDEILAKVKEFYERQLVTTKETITGISLIYTGYFTDGSEGEIQPTVAPFWYVSTVGEDFHDNRSFYYDAFTGELVGTE